MSRYLLVAHQTAASATLIQQVVELRRGDPGADFVLVVPATPVKQLLRRHQGADSSVALECAGAAQAAFSAAGVPLADARVGVGAPLQAINDEMAKDPGYDAVIISTLPEETSQWLRMDLPEQVRSQHDVPVIHVQATISDLEKMNQLP
jgi:hypothetical protein